MLRSWWLLTVGLMGCVGVVFGLPAEAGAEPPRAEPFFEPEELSLAFGSRLKAMSAEEAEEEVTTGGEQPPDGPGGPTPAGKPPPLPLHTIEGISGGCITGMAYFANPGPPGTTVSMPAASYTYLVAGTKKVHSFAVSMVFFRRLELSYAYNRVGLGSFPNDVFDFTRPQFNGGAVNIDGNINLHNINLRGILIEENSHDLPLPSIVGGVHFKIGQDIRSIDHRAGGLPSAIGFERESGVDFTLMASKTWKDPLLQRPLITSVGVRFTEAAQIGWLGFGNDWATNVEANIAWVPTNFLACAYEFRQKRSPYSRFEPLIGKEEAWHTVLVAWIIDEHTTLAACIGNLGKVANTTEHWAWGIQFKREF